MSDENLIFNPSNKNFGGEKYRPSETKSKLADFIVKISGGKIDRLQANYVMLAILGVIILATVIVVISSFGGRSVKNIPATPNEAGQNAIQ